MKGRTLTTVTALSIGSLMLAACGGDDGEGDDSKSFTLRIAANAIEGGKNSHEAEWITNYVIPEFEQRMEDEGLDATVEFIPSGVDDDQYKSKISLDMRAGKGADVVSLDGIWVGEFAQAGYIEPLSEVVGDEVDQWEGWSQIPEAVQELAAFEGQRYGIPFGTDGRVVYYNKQLFSQAGLPTDWQPASWDDILSAGQALRALPDVSPIQIQAGTAATEATTMQGFLPLLAGTGAQIFEEGKWEGASQNVADALGFYQRVYGGGLGNPDFQRAAKGRDESFIAFAEGRVGILFEGDYFWRSVVSPDAEIAPMPNRDEVVGYALIPAQQPGAGIRGQDFVSMSGGSARVISAKSQHPERAFELLTFMNSAEALTEFTKDEVRITPREDVNAEILSGDPMLSFVAEQVLPLTAYRPGLAVYPQVSTLIQEATAEVVSGTSPEDAAAAYQEELEKVVDGADNVAS